MSINSLDLCMNPHSLTCGDPLMQRYRYTLFIVLLNRVIIVTAILTVLATEEPP